MQRSVLCRSRRELSNEYLVFTLYLFAKFGFDKAENEPSKVWSQGAKEPADSSEVGPLPAEQAAGRDQAAAAGAGPRRLRGARRSGSLERNSWVATGR